MKLKTIWSSLFLQNTFMGQKSMKQIDSSDDNSEEYKLRRERNNESVRKSRAKNRLKIQDCAAHVQQLNGENYQLHKKLDVLNNELNTLKNLFHHSLAFNKNKLMFNPSEISTANLYKIITKKDLRINNK